MALGGHPEKSLEPQIVFLLSGRGEWRFPTCILGTYLRTYLRTYLPYLLTYLLGRGRVEISAVGARGLVCCRQHVVPLRGWEWQWLPRGQATLTPLKSATLEDHISPPARLESLSEQVEPLVGPHRAWPRPLRHS